MADAMKKTDGDWKQELSPEQYRVLREKGTERPFANKYNDEKAEGVYHCAGCGESLFDSAAKFNSGTGWPSFYQAIDDKVATDSDTDHGMVRTEALCAKCGGHLGHVFNDGPAPTGLRYCMNSVSLDLKPR